MFGRKLLYQFLITICWVQDYIHRVGRTARAGKSGIAISFCNQYTWQWIIEIENLIGKDFAFFLHCRNRTPVQCICLCILDSFNFGLSGVLGLYIFVFYFTFELFNFIWLGVVGKKFSLFPCTNDEVSLLMERVNEARRLAVMVCLFYISCEISFRPLVIADLFFFFSHVENQGAII